MKSLFKIVSFCWIISPLLFVVLRLANVVNVENQNVTIAIVLAFASTVVMFLNIDFK